jgi:hypothetical protein
MKYYYFTDDRVVDVDMEENIQNILFKHPQRLGGLAVMIYLNKVAFDESISLPVIDLYLSQHTNRKRFFENGQPIDYFSFGLFMFVSDRLKNILDKFNADAFYSPATVALDDSIHSYYLFCPKIAIDAIDYQKSTFSMKSEGDSKVEKIQKLLVDDSKVPSEINLFILANTYKIIRIISQGLAESLISNNITGLTVKKVEDGSWM